MQKNVLGYVLDVIFRLLWSVILTFLSSIVLIAISVYLASRTLDSGQLLEVFKGLFLPLLLLFLFLTFGPYLLSIAAKKPRPTRIRKIRTRIQKMDLETRALVTQGCRLTAICFLFAFVLTAMSNQITYFTDSAKSMIFQWTLPTYLLALVSLSLSNVLMDRIDWAVYNLERFKTTHELDNLQKALKDYNRALGSTLSIKKLLAISQYVDEGLMIGSSKEKEDMLRQLDVLTLTLRNERICDADRSLIDLSQYAEETVRKHSEFLGYEPRYPYRLKLLDMLRASSGKIFPQLMFILFWIAVLIILSYLGIKILLPP